MEQKRAAAAWGHGTIRYRRLDANGNRLTGHVWIAEAIMLDDLAWDAET